MIVAGGQTLFLLGVRNARGQDVALAQSFSPIAAVTFAFLILGEVPGNPVPIGGSIILLGIFVAQAAGTAAGLKSNAGKANACRTARLWRSRAAKRSGAFRPGECVRASS